MPTPTTQQRVADSRCADIEYHIPSIILRSVIYSQPSPHPTVEPIDTCGRCYCCKTITAMRNTKTLFHRTLARLAATIALIVTAFAITPRAGACTRVVYQGDSSLIIVGRSLDWKTPIPTNLYVYPRGITKQSSDKPGYFTWISKYGSVYAVGYDAGITEGMNEKGLQVAGLFCKTAVYSNERTDNRPPVSLAVFVAWLLDNCATTNEVISLIHSQDFTLSGATFDGGTATRLHFGVTDADGKSAILEFTAGDLKIYDPGDISCMTNDPAWPSMKAIVEYWQAVGGQNMLPGTVKSPDRCVRGDYFVRHVAKTADPDLGAAIVRSVMFNVSVPYLYTVESEPNISSTQFRTLANLRDRRYYYDLATNNGIFYIDLTLCDLHKGASVLKLTVADYPGLTGQANKYLKKTLPFKPMY